jgi:hypothetical protein
MTNFHTTKKLQVVYQSSLLDSTWKDKGFCTRTDGKSNLIPSQNLPAIIFIYVSNKKSISFTNEIADI